MRNRYVGSVVEIRRSAIRIGGWEVWCPGRSAKLARRLKTGARSGFHLGEAGRGGSTLPWRGRQLSCAFARSSVPACFPSMSANTILQTMKRGTAPPAPAVALPRCSCRRCSACRGGFPTSPGLPAAGLPREGVAAYFRKCRCCFPVSTISASLL